MYRISLALLCAMAFNAYAQDGQSALSEPREIMTRGEAKPHIGFRAGLADVDQRYETATNYGIEIGFQPYIPFGVSVGLSQFSTDRAAIAGTDGLTRTQLLAQGTYNFAGENNFVRYTYLGLALGPVLDRAGGRDAMNLAWSPVAGFDIPINNAERDYFTLGAVANYLFVGGGRPSTLALNGAVKYWF